MADASRPAERERTPAERRREPRDRSDEWRLWRLFGCSLAFIIFMLVVISVSL